MEALMDALWLAVALVVAVAGGWPVTAGALKFAKSKAVRAVDEAESGAAAGPEDGSGGIAVPTAPPVDVLRGGLIIGFLERAAVAVAIFSGQPVAIAYVVAIKGLGRYPELKDTPAASERFIIGTLASMLWAASVAAVTKGLLL